MNNLPIDGRGNAKQCFGLPVSGKTFHITTVSSQSAVSSAFLFAGTYRLHTTVDVTIATGPTATGSDMIFEANKEEYFEFEVDDTVAAFDAGAGGGIVSCTLMP